MGYKAVGKLERAIGIRDYYQKMHDRAINNLDKLEKELDEKRKECIILRDEIKSNLDIYKNKYEIDLMSFSEFRNNTYTTGQFRKAASVAYLNRKNNRELTIELYDLIKLANLQKRIVEINKRVEIDRKLVLIKPSEYQEITSQYYNKIQELMILDGVGYHFEGRIGWICINRVKLINKDGKRNIDYKASKEAKDRLIEEGKRPYDKEEADWYEEHGLPYDGVKYQVYQDVEYVYEIPLINCFVKTRSGRYKLTSADYINKSLRGKSYDEIIAECDNDVNKIIRLNVDIKKKLTMCLKANPLLYTKYIRNENQESYRFIQINRKSRQ